MKIAAILGLIGIGAAALIAADNGQGNHEKISPKVLAKMAQESGQKISVLVFLKDNADVSAAENLTTREERGQFVYDTLRNFAQERQKNLLGWLSENNLSYRPYYITNMVAVFEATPEQIDLLAKRDDVERILSDEQQRMLTPVPRTGNVEHKVSADAVGDNIKSTGADRVWNELGANGQGIVVAGQDTGVDWTHPALKPHYRGFDATTGAVDHNYNWHDAIKEKIPGSGNNSCGYNTQAPCDDDEHGSHTMGTVVGNDGGQNAIGMAPGAKWMACRNMDSGVGRPHTYIDCFEFFLAPYPLAGNPQTDGVPAKAPHVINNSWGCPGDEGCKGGEFVPVLKALKSAGIMVVVSAGNDGPNCSTMNAGPAYYTGSVLSVGAFNHKTGRIASFSSRGPSTFDGGIGPLVVAPGENIRSSVPGGEYSGAFWSGTSMAGPHVAGLVALLWSAHPEYIGQIDKTIERITERAVHKTSTQACGGISGNKIPNNTFGFGAIDAYATVAQ